MLLLIAIAVLIVIFFGWNLDWNAVSASIAKAKMGWVFAAVLGISFGYVLRAKRWQVLLSPITPTSFRELFATTTVGFSAVFLVGRTGEVVRPMWLPMRDKRVRPSAALVTLALERIFDLAAIVVFFSVNLIWFEPPKGREYEFAYAEIVGYFLLAGVFAGFIALYFYHHNQEAAIKFAERIAGISFVPEKIGKIIVSIAKQLAKSLEVLRTAKDFLIVTFWTILLWLAIALPTWFVIIAFDLPLGFGAALFVMGWAAFGSIVPTPGGAAGPFHAATASGLIVLNTSAELATAVSIVMHLVYFAPALIFGVYYFVRGDISAERFKRLISSDSVSNEST